MQPLERSDPPRLGEISLRGRIGAGGMGRVFYGVTDDYEQVAVKVIREDLVSRAEVRARFSREIEALRTVQAPHVAALVAASEGSGEGGVDGGEEQPWLAVEYVRGLSLKEYVESHGPLGTKDAATLGAVLADALKDIHRAGLLHRDLKPGNVLLGRTGPKVIDLGLVGFSDGPTDLTTTETRLGTPEYMSAEQIDEIKGLTPACDVYALGATLLFALTGHPPYRAASLPALFTAIANPDVPPDLGGVPAEFTSLLGDMLSHAPAARPAVPQLYERFRAMATADGITLPVATRRLAGATYIERESDPEDVAPSPRPRRRDISELVIPGSVVARLADRLRVAYAATARF